MASNVERLNEAFVLVKIEVGGSLCSDHIGITQRSTCWISRGFAWGL